MRIKEEIDTKTKIMVCVLCILDWKNYTVVGKSRFTNVCVEIIQ